MQQLVQNSAAKDSAGSTIVESPVSHQYQTPPKVEKAQSGEDPEETRQFPLKEAPAGEADSPDTPVFKTELPSSEKRTARPVAQDIKEMVEKLSTTFRMDWVVLKGLPELTDIVTDPIECDRLHNWYRK